MFVYTFLVFTWNSNVCGRFLSYVSRLFRLGLNHSNFCTFFVCKFSERVFLFSRRCLPFFHMGFQRLHLSSPIWKPRKAPLQSATRGRNNAPAKKHTKRIEEARPAKSMKSAERREPRHQLHTKLSVCTTKKLSCLQTRKNCLLKLLHRASGSLEMRGHQAAASAREREQVRRPTEDKKGEPKRHAKKRVDRPHAYPHHRRSGQ